MSYDEIAHLDFTPDPGTGLRERALKTWGVEKAIREERQQRQVGELLLHAQRCITDVLDVVNATKVVVKPRPSDGDGDVFCQIDGMEFKVSVVYPTGGGEEPNVVKLFVKTGNNYAEVNDILDLGRYLDKDLIRVKEEEECATD